MFDINKKSDNRVDITISGKVDREMMKTGVDDLIEKSESVKSGSMLYTFTDFQMPSWDAFGVEFTRIPKLFGLLSKYERIAVVSDAAWIRTGAEIEGALIPGVQIKSFELSEKADAEKWLGGK